MFLLHPDSRYCAKNAPPPPPLHSPRHRRSARPPLATTTGGGGKGSLLLPALRRNPILVPPPPPRPPHRLRTFYEQFWTLVGHHPHRCCGVSLPPLAGRLMPLLLLLLGCDGRGEFGCAARPHTIPRALLSHLLRSSSSLRAPSFSSRAAAQQQRPLGTYAYGSRPPHFEKEICKNTTKSLLPPASPPVL